ncbi:flotillin family protein [Streptomyces cellulosae]|uniref:Flotillin family protein n=1 Tax=Streptomyces thermocarboxydus TaxID=59299 RepID=A0ABU3J369_9ACTN|nr:flotillin family protein [Streptomyces sp. McG7]MBT2902696.1 flotillin family protein [Streptomyces sp. McG8]MDT6968468.1 flotillin family protein [Streptomyces thermocarboxydus]MDX3418229.1 flotillin family protein [Streptomyces sp. MD20-1-1]MXQ56671.1 flotillin family protein [Streptomyces sp. XHT-2]MYQ30209.1 flotillin family protein [Streptomyces sp. SID4956]MYW54026.1 flotillin family protein [Streptomyces sp. SID8376]THC57063.1 flotillin family protein [Streptomyces sp. Akac8]WSB44
MDAATVGIAVLVGAALLLVLIGLLLVTKLFRKVEQGKALIVSKLRKVDVTFTGSVVLPVLHKAEVMDISVKTIEITRAGKEGLICRDNIRADIRITFFVKVNKTAEDVVKVAQAVGTARASDRNTLQELFHAKFSEALKTVGKQMDFTDLYTKREELRYRIIEVIGVDLNGYHLEDAAIDYLEQTPLTQLDPGNVLDAQGIRKITELTAVEHVRTNEAQRNEEKEITRQDVDAREAILELQRRQTDAEIKQKREIETVRAREEAETARVVEEERLRAQSAFLRTEEQLGVQRENQAREVAVAAKNRERVIAVESERIEKDRLLEVIARERETELTRIAAEKEVEAEKREIAEVIRERVAVDRTVAEQEESIKKLRAVEEAERQRQAVIIAAEAEAQEKLVKDIKAAEAAEQAAAHRAAEELTLAEARLKTADLDAKAKLRLAEGVQAESAAEGLAAVQVRDKEAEVIEKAGRAEAEATEARLRAEAEGARAKAVAEAEAISGKLRAEAAGLTEKAAAMAALDEASRGHEEYRLRLEAEKDVRLAGLDVQRQVAEAQATVLATGLENADINIVGGDSVFFDRLVSSISLGRSVDGFVKNSETAQALAGPWLDGSASFTDDLSRMLGSVSTSDVQNLTVSALLMKLMKQGGENTGQFEQLLDKAGELGLADTPLAVLNGRTRA